MDQMESSQVSFYAQSKGTLTKRRYKAATVFVDHFSDLKYVHFMEALTSDETLYAKQSFERYARQHGVIIKHYHCDNGRFSDKTFIDDVTKKGQTISYCAAYAHLQNDKTEKGIRDIQEMACTMLLHARARWPDAIHLALWPYAMRMAVTLMNTIPDEGNGSTRLERFASVAVQPKMQHHHTFGCPVLAMTAEAEKGMARKWDTRAKLGIYLGPLPLHAGSVSLVLNMETGLCLPRFNVVHDDFFEMVRYAGNHAIPKSRWHQISGLDFASAIRNRQRVAQKAALECINESHEDPPKQALEGGDVRNGPVTSSSIDDSTYLELPLQEEPSRDERSRQSSDGASSPQDTPEMDRAPLANEELQLEGMSFAGRVHRPTRQLQESHDSGEYDGSWIAFQSTFETSHDQSL